MKPYSKDLREKVLTAVDRREATITQIAETFGVTRRWIHKLLRQREKTGRIDPRPHSGGASPKVDEAAQRRLRRAVEEKPDATLEELRDAAELDVDPVTVWRWLRRLDMTRKKKVRRASERNEPEIQATRRQWEERRRGIDPERFVFLDETGVSTRMHRDYGWAPRGERVAGLVPERHYEAMTVLGGVRLNGDLPTMIYEGGTDVEAMLAYIQTCLAPRLAAGDIVALDNLPSHKSARVVEAIEATGAEVWPLPSYSPDFNPIEEMWSKTKAFLRDIGARARDELLEAVGAALETVTPLDIQHWFNHCGYENTGL